MRSPSELGSPDLVIIPGTKTTIADLGYMRECGMAEARRREDCRDRDMWRVPQMLGRRILDPDRLESEEGAAPGLGLLPVVTRFSSQKQTTHQASGWVSGDHGLLAGAKGMPFEGYEIHM